MRNNIELDIHSAQVGEKDKLLRSTFGAISAKAPVNIEIDTLRYDDDGRIIKGSGEFYNELQEINVKWADNSIFNVEQNVTKEVAGEPKLRKTAKPAWLQITEEIGKRGKYPETVRVGVKRAFVNGSKLEKPTIEGELPFADVQKYVVKNLKKTFSEYNGGRRVNLIYAGKELTAREVTQQGGRTGKIPETTVFRAK